VFLQNNFQFFTESLHGIRHSLLNFVLARLTAGPPANTKNSREEIFWITEPGVLYNIYMSISELPATVEVIEAFRERFMCRRCGACCTVFDGVKVTENEMRGLGIPKTEWQDAFTKIEGIYYMKEPCRFYNSNRAECTIYNDRPETCRNFPVHTVNCEDGLIHLSVSETCPAALQALAEVEVEFMGR
jgi:Fe-S-cluster containining protein